MRASALAMLAALASLAGCGEDRSDGGGTARTSPIEVRSPPTAPGAAVATLDVSLTEYRLAPAQARATRSGVIAFVATNDGLEVHALQVDGPAGEARSGALRPGERTTLEVRLPPGTYRWLCPIADHERRGMRGRVRVAE